MSNLQMDYLDLLEKVLTGLIYGDPPIDPATKHLGYNQRVRIHGLDWPSKAHTMVGLIRLRNIRRCVLHVLQHSISGDFIETGVWRGGAAIYMRGILKAFDVNDRTVWAADSFEGLPPPEDRCPADRGDKHYTVKDLAVSLEEVQRNFAIYGLLDEQVRFLKGWFKDTLPNAPIEKIAILRLDGDMYASTMDALTPLYDKVSIGGFVIVDDYGSVPACKQAVDDFRNQFGIVDPVQSIDDVGIFWQRTK